MHTANTRPDGYGIQFGLVPSISIRRTGPLEEQTTPVDAVGNETIFKSVGFQ